MRARTSSICSFWQEADRRLRHEVGSHELRQTVDAEHGRVVRSPTCATSGRTTSSRSRCPTGDLDAAAGQQLLERFETRAPPRCTGSRFAGEPDRADQPPRHRFGSGAEARLGSKRARTEADDRDSPVWFERRAGRRDSDRPPRGPPPRTSRRGPAVIEEDDSTTSSSRATARPSREAACSCSRSESPA